MSRGTAVLALVALAALGVVAALAVRRPALRRLALRSIVRRPGESALVVLGSLLGTAIITGSLLVGDTLGASIRAAVPAQLGPVDLVVRAGGPDAAAAARAALADVTADPAVDGVLPVVVADGALATPAGGDGLRRAVPRVQLLEVDFDDAGRFDRDPAVVGVVGPTPLPGRVVLAEGVAADLGVGAGAALELYAYGQQLVVTVDQVLPRVGLVGFADEDFAEQVGTALVPPGTLSGLVAPLGADPGDRTRLPRELLLVSAEGGVFDAADRGEEALAAVGQRLAGVPAVDVEPVKARLLAAADAAGDSFGQLFLSVGSFAVLAGVLLLVNIFVMLAEERKGELGMLRAVGMSRPSLVAAFCIEGAVYALAAAGLGALAGIAVGRVIVAVTAGIFAGTAASGLELRFSPGADSILTGLLLGLLIGLATVAVTSVRTSRITIIRAIRDLPEPPSARRSRRARHLLAVGALAAAAASVPAIAAGDAVAGQALPAGAVALGALAAGGTRHRRVATSGAAAAVLLWGFAVPQLLWDAADVPAFVVRGVLLTFSAVVLVTQHAEVVGALVRAVAGGRTLATRLGLAYPLARRFRTGMTLLMYSLVIFTLVFLAVLSNLFAGQAERLVDREGGGFDLLATANPANPVDPDVLAAVEGVAAVAPLAHGLAAWRVGSSDGWQVWPASGVDEALVAGGPPGLDEWDTARWSGPEAVWRAVLADPTLVVVDQRFLQRGGGPPERPVDVGGVVEVQDRRTGAVVPRTVAAISDAGMALSGVFLSQASFAEALGPPVVSRYHVAVAPGTDLEGLAAELQGAFLPHGLQARPFAAIVEENLRVQDQFFSLMQGYLALGLLVGIAGLGVVMVRAVRERRRQIGMLRSIGFQASTVQSAFLVESGFVALEGLLIGTALAIVSARQLVADVLEGSGIAFDVPWLRLAVVLGVALAASLLATLAPARRAAAIKPAVALRLQD